MAKQLNVNLAFTADTSKAKAQLQDLQNQLSSIGKLPANTKLQLTEEIQKASSAAMELQTHLKNATNVETGTLDFSKLSKSLKDSGTSLQAYGKTLKDLGPQGQKAFMSLASAVSQAEIPIRRSNAQLKELVVSLKNTARWQISSSALHGFMGALSTAYGYAKDLDKSLNDIRIVTGQNADEMARFAKMANESAKSLSTTTTNYTNASLIYYQQGLSDDEVKKRTDVTIKMANAAGASAEKVSNQLTAVWNNFYDGTKSLEYYADVMTALGAATASSTDEIAGGLEKFAAIGDTIGLSYEYAASALATITSNTRQSEEVVGTALKTIFARIQGLNLGETLDDGTTLNKYSKALESVGVSIFDANNEIKTMDNILDDLAGKWQTISKDQQIALAQTVAGTRQYTQLVALMDNWNKGDSDSMIANLNTAYNSEGALQEQADIYAESWEASRDRVRAAAEGIYDALLDEKFFTGLNNFLTFALDGVLNLIKGLGGLQGTLAAIGAIVTKIFNKELAQSMRNMAYNLQMSTTAGRNKIENERQKTLSDMSNDLAISGDVEDPVGKVMAAQYKEQMSLQAQLRAQKDSMNESEIAHVQKMLDLHRQVGEVAVQAAEREQKTKEKSFDLYSQIIEEASSGDNNADPLQLRAEMQDLEKVAARLEELKPLVKNAFDGNTLAATEQQFVDIAMAVGHTKESAEELYKEIKSSDAEKQLEILSDLYAAMADNAEITKKALKGMNVSDGTIDKIVENAQERTRAHKDLSEAEARAVKLQETTIKRMEQAKGEIKDWANGIVSAGEAVLAFGSIVESIQGAIDSLKDPNMSGWDKFFAVLSSGVAVITMLIQSTTAMAEAAKLLSGIKIKETIATLANVAAEALQAAAKKASAAAERLDAEATRDNTDATEENTQANVENAASTVDLKEALGNLKTAIGQFLSKYGSLMATVALGAAIVVGSIYAYDALEDAFNRDAEAAKKAQEEAQKLSDSYKSAKMGYDNFTSTVSAYDSARSGLDNLVEGTDEFREAIINANAEAMTLINTIEGLKYIINKDGLIEIDAASLEAAQQQQLDILQQQQQASMMATQNARNAQLKADTTKFNRDIAANESVSGDDWNVTGRGAAVGAGIGAGVATAAVVGAKIGGLTGSLVGPLGTAIGAAIGVALGGLTGAIVAAVNDADQTEYEEDALDAISKYYAKNGETALTKEGMEQALTEAGLEVDDDYINSLLENKDATRELMESIKQNTIANQQLNESLITNEYGDKIEGKAYLSDEQKSQLTSVLGKDLDTRTKELYENEFKDGKGKDDATIQKEYAKAMGWSENNIDNHTGNKATYYDMEGNIVAENLSDETARMFLAQQEALKQMGQNVDNYAQTFQRLTQMGEGIVEGAGTLLTSMAGGEGADVGLATQSQVSGLQDKLSTSNATEIISDADAKQMGYDSAQAYVDALNESLANAQIQWDKLTLLNASNLDTSQMTLAVAQAFNESIQQANLGPTGAAAGKEFTDGINKMLADVDADDMQDALAALSTIDWSDWDALEQADAIMKEFGVDIDTGSQEWIEFASNMRLATGAQPEFSRLKDTLAEISGILGGLDFGDIIDDEDYAKLVAYNDEWEKFFIMQADGTRKFIGSSTDMARATRESIQQQRDDLQKRKEIQEAFAKTDWSVNGDKVDWSDYENFDMIGGATNLANAGGATQDMLELLGYDDATINDMVAKAQSTNATVAAEAQARLAEMYQRIAAFEDEDMVEMDAMIDEMMASTATNITELNSMLQEGAISTEAYTKQVQALSTELANEATTLAELDAVVDQFGLNENDEAYVQNLMRIAEGYESCTDELLEYQLALNNFDPDTGAGEEELEQAEEKLRAMISLEEAAEKYGLEVEVLTAQSKRLAKQYGLTAQEAADLAVKNQRMNKGVESLVDNWSDWKKQLTATDKTTQDYAETIVDCTAAIADLVGACEDLELPDEFFNADNMALIERAITGDTEAINQLGFEVGLATVNALEFNAALASLATQTWIENGLDVDITLDATQFDTDLEIVRQGINDLKNGVITSGQEMDAEWVAALNRMALTTGMTVEDMNGLLGSIGVQAKVETSYVKQPIEVPTYTEVVQTLPGTTYQIGNKPDGTPIYGQAQGIRRYTIPGQPLKTEGYVAVAQISTEDNPMTLQTSTSTVSSGGGGTGASYSGNRGSVSPSATSGSSSGGGGSSSSKSDPQKADEVKKTEIVDRYKQIEDKLDDVRDAADDAASAMDRLYGENRIKKMQEQNALLQKEIDLLEQKKAEAIDYLAEDKAALQEAAAEAGVSFSFDEEGNIRNYETQMTALYNLLDAAIQTANADGDATDEEQEAIDAIQEKIDAVKDAIAQYDETRELITDLDKEAQEKFNEWQDNNFEILNYTLELKLEVNDDNLQRLEYYLNKLEDDFYQMAESAALMVADGGQWDQYTQNIEEYQAYLAKLKEDYEAGRISEDAYVEGVKEVKNGIYENLEALNELDKTMMEYYGETLAAAGDELAKYTDLMEHQTSVLEHYANVMELLGKQNDYKAMGVILEAQAALAENAVEVSKANYEMLAAEASDREAAYRQALSQYGEDSAITKAFKKQWEDAQIAANEAQEQMLSDVEAWAEAINAVLDNKLNSLAQALENSLTGGYGSFDEMTNAMERANSLQEEYLTTTNQVYETNKLMRAAQQEIDKTTNSLAKTRLKQFINETQQLQDQTELSQYELEIQQAKYDLLLAEIALEEAQAAKSIVRLQRDSEGNFGYVYTADESQIADAQQKLEDAQNSLYNIALEGANEYSQKYAETLKEMNDTLIAINEAYRNGEYESEQEYQQALAAAREYYYEKMKQYSELYQVAIVTDGRVVEEAWSSEFASMTMETEQWMWAVDEYIENVRDAFSLWEEQMDRVEDLTVGPDLDSLKEKVGGVVDANEDLTESITKEVIPGIQAEIDAVKKITSAYSLAREARLRYIQAGERVANTAAQDLGEYIDNFDWDNTSGGSSGSGSAGSSSGSGTESGSSTPEGDIYGSESGTSNELTWDRIMSAYDQIVSGAWGNGVANRIKRGVAAGYTEDEVRAAQQYINYTFPKNQNGYGYSKAKAKELLGFDTGGYTGEWAGSYGKLALLHQKELILEPGDTENFLDAMSILDRIVQMIDLQSMSAQLGGIISAPGMGNMNNGVLEQMVHIEAHFEGATDRYEIEAAFDNLINRASQQANQK